jgi:hydrogenase maturation protein HypF
VFLNEFVLVNCLVKLRAAGFAAYAHRQVPPNDGGIALGQAVVAGARITAQAAPGGLDPASKARSFVNEGGG